MTDKQRKFADEYIVDCNATRAYMAAYSNVKNKKVASAAGARLLANVNIKAYIEQRLEKISSEKVADAQEVMEYWTSVMRGDTESEVVVVEGVGDGCSEARKIVKKPDERERLRASENLGKRFGLHKENISITGVLPVMIVDDLDDEDDEV